VVSGHKSAAHTDSPDGGTGKTCLGEGRQCPSASSLISVSVLHVEKWKCKSIEMID